MTTRFDLQQFNLAGLREIRKVRRKIHRYGDPYELFWNEIEAVLRTKPPYLENEWQKLEKDFVIGEVWSQPIGEFYYNHTVHRFSYLYVESSGVAIEEHGHEEPANGGKQMRKMKEWYIFPDGRSELCSKGETHRLVNNYGKPIYVLSIKIGGKGIR